MNWAIAGPYAWKLAAATRHGAGGSMIAYNTVTDVRRRRAINYRWVHVDEENA